MVSGGFLKRSLLFSIAIVISVGTILPLFTSTVSAANINTVGPVDEAKSTSYYRTLRTCVNNEMNTNIQLTASDNGVANPSKWFSDNYSYGYVYPEGKKDCKDIVPLALKLWGWGADYSAFLRELGFTYNAGDAKWTVANRDNLRSKFDSAVQAKYYGVNFAGEPTQSGAARYEMFFNVFSEACNAKDLGAVSSITNSSYKSWLGDSTADMGKNVTANTAGVSGMSSGSEVYFVKVDVVETVDGELRKVPHGYAYQASSAVTNAGWNGENATSNGDVRIYGYHNSAVERSCHQIQKGITENAAAWQEWARSQPTEPIPPKSDSGGTTPGAEGGEGVSSCGIEALGWILCPVINFLAGVADASFNFLADSFLKTDPKVFDTDDGVYKAWAAMRNLANILFVIAFIYIVFSQLTGIGISNYGVKKLLPRIVVAAVLVNVSYFISQLAIDVSNILGYSIRDVFAGIISSINQTGTSTTAAGMSNFATGGGGGFIAIAGAILGTGLAVLTVYLMLSAFGPILLAVVLALILIFFILIARQAIIVMLVVLSPLAFVAFLLPNTESLFKSWRKIFTAMLMLFPIIALVYGGSALASSLIGTSFTGIGENGTESALFGQIIAAAVLILPLFAVPVLLRKSLDAVPEVGKLANKWANKGFSNVGNKVKEGNRNSYIGKGSAIRKQQRQVYSDRKFAENVSKGGLGALAAKGVAVLPKGKYARNAVGRIADEASEKAFENDISAMAVSLRNTHNNPDTQIDDIAGELTSAIKSGDKVKARAAQSILLNSGGAGIDTLHRTLRSVSESDPNMRKSEVGVSLRTALNNAGLKGKDNAMATWAYTDSTFEAIGNGTATIDVKNPDGSTSKKQVSAVQGLNSVELAGQRGHVIEAAKHLITPAQAKAVLADNVSKDMDPKKKALFEEISRGMHVSGRGTGGTPPPTGGPTGGTPPSTGGPTGGTNPAGTGPTGGNTPPTGGTQAGTAGAASGGTNQPAGSRTQIIAATLGTVQQPVGSTNPFPIRSTQPASDNIMVVNHPTGPAKITNAGTTTSTTNSPSASIYTSPTGAANPAYIGTSTSSVDVPLETPGANRQQPDDKANGKNGGA